MTGAVASSYRSLNFRYWRWLLAAATTIFGCMSLAATTANVLQRTDPVRAATLAPDNGRVASAAAQQIQFSRSLSHDRARAVALARLAIIDDPTAVDALLVLAFEATLNSDAAGSAALFKQANRLSRRELRAQIWAIEDAISRGDVIGALKNYDIALRTSSDAPRVLFATLGGALSEPRIRKELLKILQQRPFWSSEFLAFLAGSTVDPRSAAIFFSEAPQYGLAPDDTLQAQLVNQLVTARAFDEAFTLYRRVRPGATRTQSRDATFALHTKQRAAFDWKTGDEPGMSVAILSDEPRGIVDFAVAAQTGGVVLSQLQLLPPGRYRLEGTMDGIDQPLASRPYWALTCETGLDLGRVDLAENTSAFSGLVVVPPRCAVQTLALIARPTDSIGGVTGQVRRAILTPQVN